MAKIVFRYAPKLYLGQSMNEEKLDKIKKKLDKNPFFANVWILAFATSPLDQLEFYDSKWIRFRSYEGFEPYVVGICKNEQEALELVERIAKDCFSERGDCALREYLSWQAS